MKKVITYGTYDMLHFGHIRLLERAKKLGDYLIVGVTADDFDKLRGKINVKQSLMERVEAVRATGLADEIIIEEYEGQKIDDIKKYDIDIFTVGSDWVGKFDYLKEYCDVVYLERTEGVSSSMLRTEKRNINFGIIGDSQLILKHINESEYVNGLSVSTVCTKNKEIVGQIKDKSIKIIEDYEELLATCDAIYVASNSNEHYEQVKKAINLGKHVLCESPIALTDEDCEELYELANSKNVILMEAIKTAYSPAFNRLILMTKSGKIGNVVSIDATCTSLKEYNENDKETFLTKQNSMCAWGPTALLPIFMLLGTNYNKKHFSSYYLDEEKKFDLFTKVDFNYSNAVASLKVGKGVKSEGDLTITGTKGYIYVPSPWWKTDYFEARFEDQSETKRYFYQLDGEGIRYELVTFVKSIENNKNFSYISKHISESIALVLEDFNNKENLDEIIL